MKRKLLIGLILLCALATVAEALSATLSSVEMDIVLRPDGKADFYESLDWRASGGLMHGFSLEGTAVTPVFNREQCYADLAGSVRSALDIRDLGGGRYDIVLANGRGFTGSAMYFLTYGGDLAGAGRIGWTKSADFGELFYFDWAAGNGPTRSIIARSGSCCPSSYRGRTSPARTSTSSGSRPSRT